MKRKVNKKIMYHLSHLYKKAKEERLEEIMKILSSSKAEKQNKEKPGMNGEAWFYFIQNELERKDSL